MIATFVTWPYGTVSKTGDRCLILGFKEEVSGAVCPIIADLKTGELSTVALKDVVVDADKLRKLPLH